jgi:hypothetical protein
MTTTHWGLTGCGPAPEERRRSGKFTSAASSKKKKTNRLARRFLRKQSGTAPLRVPRGDVGHAASPRRRTSHLFFLIFRRLVSTPSGSLLEAALLRLKTDHPISRPASTADAPRRLQLRASRCLKAPGSRRLRSDLNKPSLHSLSISLRIRNRPLM